METSVALERVIGEAGLFGTANHERLYVYCTSMMLYLEVESVSDEARLFLKFTL